jgi:hypothetical protein
MPPPRKSLRPASSSEPANGSGSSSSFRRNIKTGRSNWHTDIQAALDSGKWEHVQSQITLFQEYQATLDPSERDKKKNFWRRLSNQKETKDHTGLRAQDKEGRTPLHLALTSNKTPSKVITGLLQLEPKVCALVNERKRLPLHFAVVHRHHIEVIGEIIESYPGALGATDIKGKSPLAYAMEMAKRESSVQQAPRTFWMPVNDGTDEAEWQESQGETWGVVHWLLLSSATHPQTSLSVGGQKPMLVEALLHAAPPAVISLLIGASSMLLSFDNRATAFAGSTLYSCITRHYPISILMSLASQCPADVRKVRDETGMGLLSALFISGCFEPIKNTGEWTVSPGFYNALEETIQEGVLYNVDPAFVDWWKKIEFLVAFCGEDKASEVPKNCLLHAALSNSDVPPIVIRVLLSLYPKSISLPDPKQNVPPIHAASSCREYIPRQYESQSIGKAHVLEIVVEADKNATNTRHQHRLPLNVAIESGKMYESLETLVLSNKKALCHRDQRSRLYPFQQAAAYPNRGDEDSFRWSCVARNKFSHAVWRGLSGRQKAAAVYRVVEEESLCRLDTIYELLRREPGVIKPSKPKKAPVSVARDSSGMGMVAAHYMTWCYKTEKGEWRVNEANMASLRYTIQEAARTGRMGNVPPDFIRWWGKLKFWIRYCCPTKFERDDETFVLPNGDEFLLHAALMNSDTPPHVVELLLALHAVSTSMNMPGNSKLPLHIAAQTTPYTARPFELIRMTSLELTSKAYPGALRVLAKGQLPLHVAINAGKTWEELMPIVEEEPRALRARESTTGLYPFQAMAIRQIYTIEQRLRFQYLARNGVDASTTKRMSPQDFSKEVRNVQKEYQLDVLSSIYEILRKDASVIRPSYRGSTPVVTESVVTTMATAEVESPDVAESTAAASINATAISQSQEELNSSTAGESYCSEDKEPNAAKPPTPLIRLLSLGVSRSEDDPDVFECDTSTFSNVDVMSTLSSSYNDFASQDSKRNLGVLAASSHKKREAPSIHSIVNQTLPDDGFSDGSNSSDSSEDSFEMGDETSRHAEFGEDSTLIEEISRHAEFGEDSTQIDETSRHAEFGEDSEIQSEATRASGPSSSAIPEESALIMGNSDPKEVPDADETENSTESVVIFNLRRKPRVEYWKGQEDSGNAVRLCKKPQSSQSQVQVPSSVASVGSARTKSEQSVQPSAVTATSDGYRSLAPGERLLKSQSDMIWVGPDILGKMDGDARNQDDTDTESCVITEHQSISSDELPSASQHSVALDGPTEHQLAQLNNSVDMMWIDDEDDLDLNDSFAFDQGGPVSASMLGLAEKENGSDRSIDEFTLLGLSTVQPSSADQKVAADSQQTIGRQIESAVPVSETYFCKRSMSWKVRPKSENGAANEMSNNFEEKKAVDKTESKDTKLARKDGEKLQMYFDKRTMRWKAGKAPPPSTEAFDSSYRSVTSDSSSYYEPVKEHLQSPPTKKKPDKVRNSLVETLSTDPVSKKNRAFSKAKHASDNTNREHVLAVSKGSGLESTFRSQSTSGRTLSERHKKSRWYALLSKDREFSCLLCSDNNREVLLLPCRHLAICKHCSVKEANIPTCPLCERDVTDRILIF